MFKNPFSFQGRIRRLEYGLSYLIYSIVSTLVSIMMQTNETFHILGFILFLPLLWFIIAQGAKRCHDRENSGWYQLIPFYQLWMIFADGQVGENRYGDNPKGIGNKDFIEELGMNS